jgi:hypothetical protein
LAPYGFAEEPDTQNANDGASYLRRLKEQPPLEPSDMPQSATVAAAAPQSSYGDKDRRRSPRFRCAGSAEFTAQDSNVRMWGTMTDISLRGCYVEMTTTFPVDTKVDLVLEAMGIRFRAQGVIRISYPFLGMGILFTEIVADQKALLERLLSALGKVSNVSQLEASLPSSSEDSFVGADPIPFLNELKRYFDGKPVLSREEFFRIARQCPRP